MDVWGEWNRDTIHNGVIYNKADRYIFIGEFEDFKLTTAKGNMLYLRDNENEHGIIAYEGKFI